MFQIWGIINLSTDSFYTPSKIRSLEDLVLETKEYLSKGVNVIDIGAESTRPYSKPLYWEDEWHLLQPYLVLLKNKISKEDFSTKISIDTYKHEVATRCLEMGIGIINDVRGLESSDMIRAIANFNAKVVIMHSKGTPKTMQDNPTYGNILEEVLSFLQERTQQAIQAGILKENIIWDYGIGFGKTVEHNLTLLKNSFFFKKYNYPLLIGISRKSFLGKILGLEDPKDRGAASLVLHTYLAQQKQISIIRTHDIIETLQMRTLLQLL